MRFLILDGFIEMASQFVMSSTNTDVISTETKRDLSRFEVTSRPIKVTGWFPKIELGFLAVVGKFADVAVVKLTAEFIRYACKSDWDGHKHKME